MKLVLSFLIGFFICSPIILNAQNNLLEIPNSTTEPVIDGHIDLDEWSESSTFQFNQNGVRNTRVLIKKTNEHIYVAFEHLIDSSGVRLNPEILIDTNLNNTQWTDSSFWFHSSHSNCFSVGEYYNWTNCKQNQEGWQANLFPFLNEIKNIEFKISFKKLGIDPKKQNELKIAFKIGNVKNQIFYYPLEATIENPSSWLDIKIQHLEIY